MTAKVRIKAGPVEFEYEGETELGVADIKDLFTHIETLFKVPVLAEGGDSHALVQQPNVEPIASNNRGPKLHVNSVAKKLAAKTGPQVAEAAAAALQIYDGKQTFTRGELLEMMKKATMHYKGSMAGNLTKILETLVGTQFNQVSDGVYSLSSDAFQDLEMRLA